MKVFHRNEDGSRGRFLYDADDDAWVAFKLKQLALQRVRAEATDRLRAARLRISRRRFGHGGGNHREDARRHRRDDPARLLYRLITG